MNVDWKGIYPATTTAINADQSVNLEETAAVADRLIKAGVHGIVALGTVGENTSLEYGEKIDVLKAVAKTVNGRVPLLTGVAENSAPVACRFVADAEKAGVDGLMVLPAMVYPADGREILAHFRQVAGSTKLPILCYNNPISYKVDITPEMFASLADVENLVAIKESSEDPRRITDLRNAVGDRYILFNGVDDIVLESAAAGAEGWVSGLTDAFPAESLRLWDAALHGRLEEARALNRWFAPLLHLDTHPKLVQYIKLAMVETGMGTEEVRLPRLKIEGEERERILGIIRTAIKNRPAAK